MKMENNNLMRLQAEKDAKELSDKITDLLWSYNEKTNWKYSFLPKGVMASRDLEKDGKLKIQVYEDLGK